ncbi:DUF2207 family protein [Kiloniella sp. b19]|uniref:DUF2207 family protein n=1 Tax=Kiloniella sp. GXU_MW_B19 TaxID=3141326 RepID=UPI0031D0642A
MSEWGEGCKKVGNSVSRVVLWITAVLFMLLCSAQSWAASSLRHEISVGEKGRLEVTTLVEFKPGALSKPALYFEFPTIRRVGNFLNRKTDFELISVMVNGRKQDFFLEELAGERKARLSLELPRDSTEDQKQTVAIEYSFSGLFRTEGGREFIDFPVYQQSWVPEASRISVVLRSPVEPGGFSLSGLQSSEGYRVVKQRDGVLGIGINPGFALGETLSLRALWPLGAASGLGGSEDIRQTVDDNRGLWVGIVLSVAMALFLLVNWMRLGVSMSGNQAVLSPVIPPLPEGITPLLAAGLWKQQSGFERRFLIVLISLALKKKIVIRLERNAQVTLRKRVKGKYYKTLSEDEQALFLLLFPGRRTELSWERGQFDASVDTVGELRTFDGELDAILKGQLKQLYRQASGTVSRIGFGLGALGLLLTLLLDAANVDYLLFTGLLLVVGQGGLILGLKMLGGLWDSVFAKTALGFMGWVFCLLLLLVSGVFMIPIAAALFIAGQVLPLPVVVLSFVPILLVLFFTVCARRPDRLGRAILEPLYGYRQLLDSIIRGRERGYAAGKAGGGTFFEQHLPFALALGREEDFARQVLDRTGAGEDYQPDWIIDGSAGQGWNRNSFRAFRRLENSVKSAFGGERD